MLFEIAAKMKYILTKVLKVRFLQLAWLLD